MDFDAVLTVGAQSLLDGLWRILQPALPRLNAPIPVPIPGMAGSLVSIRQILPELTVDTVADPMPPATRPQLVLHIDLGASGDAVLLTADDVAIVPTSPPTLRFSVPLKLPFTVPVKINSAQGRSLYAKVTLDLDASRIVPETSNSLHLVLRNPSLVWEAGPDQAEIENQLASAKAQVLSQLGMTPGFDVADVHGLAARLQTGATAAVKDTLTEALTRSLTDLSARTGRLIFSKMPVPDPGTPCDFSLSPHEARARLTRSSGRTVLQVGFATLPGKQLPADPAWPEVHIRESINPGIDVTVDVGNQLLMRLLCCMVQKIPTFAFPSGHAHLPTDPLHPCCVWGDVTLAMLPIGMRGSLKLCISELPLTSKKQIVLEGTFDYVPQPRELQLVRIHIRISLRLAIGMDSLAAIDGLHLFPDVEPSVTVTTEPGDALAPLVAGTLILSGFLAAQLIGFIVGLLDLLRRFIEDQLREALRTVLGPAQNLVSAAAIPSGLFDALGKLAPADITLDDLIVRGTLETPSTPWAVLPTARGALPLEPLGFVPFRSPLPDRDERPRKSRSRSAAGRKRRRSVRRR